MITINKTDVQAASLMFVAVGDITDPEMTAKNLTTNVCTSVCYLYVLAS